MGIEVLDNGVDHLRKPPGMPWVDVPIVSRGKFFGMLSADKLQEDAGKQSWGQITEMDLDALDIFAQLATRAFSMEESRGMLIGENLRILEQFLGIGEQIELVQRRLLIFLTHGEQGLGFNRALYFHLPKDGDKKPVLASAVGSPTREKHEQLIGNIRGKGLECILKEANVSHDEELRRSVESIPGAEFMLNHKLFEHTSVVRYSKEQSDRPEFIRHLQDYLNWKDILVASLSDEQRTCGFFVVDRAWDEYGVDHTDVETLSSFSKHAAHELLQHMRLEERMSLVEPFAKAIVHELRFDWCDKIRTLAASLEHCDSDTSEAIDTLAAQANRSQDILSVLTEVFYSVPNAKETTPISEVDTILNEIKAQSVNREIEPVKLENTIQNRNFPIKQSQLKLVLGNLIANAAEASDNGPIQICVGVDANSSLRLSVINLGVALSDGKLKELNQGFMVESTKQAKEFGFGVFLSHWVIRQVGGKLKYDAFDTGQPIPGVRASICFPCPEIGV